MVKINLLSVFLLTAFCTSSLIADPCGMVPPIYNGQGPPITRVGLQKTYVFYKDGVETFVIRPGFSGKVDEFGMLIPFPSVPAIRKTPDDLFEHIVNAIDPPEVVVDLRIIPRPTAASRIARYEMAYSMQKGIAKDQVKVIKKEAVGMYEVAVLAAGSAQSLKKWMDEYQFRYPAGMDEVTEDYIKQKWCFVAVKTRVAEKGGVDPKPNQRSADGKMNAGSAFDGFVQGMGFRFKTDEIVVPMRLSAFNGSDFHNVVYIMADGPRRIRNIPEEYVVRQISGKTLLHNLSQPLPLRIIGGTEKDLSEHHRKQLLTQRNPTPKNGLAKQLFASDLMAIQSDELSLQHEEDEKQLLQIGEHFGLRGKSIDAENATALKKAAEKNVAEAVKDIADMTLTVVDGNFPREVLAGQNLAFVQYSMPTRLNNRLQYDATRFGPGQKKSGVLIRTSLLETDSDQQIASSWLNWFHPTIPLSVIIGIGLCFLIRLRKVNASNR